MMAEVQAMSTPLTVKLPPDLGQVAFVLQGQWCSGRRSGWR